MALSGSSDKTLKLWDIATGKGIRTFKGHSDSVRSVAFSPDGCLALSGSRDKTITQWNVATGKEIVRMFSFDNDGWLSMTPEGYYTASKNAEQFIRFRIGKEIHGIEKYRSKYHRPDIVRKALCQQYLMPERKSALKGEIFLPSGHSSTVSSVAFSPNGRIENIPFIEVESRNFKNMIDKTSMMTGSVKDKRPHVLGVCLETIQKEDENWIRIISTDGNRLAKVDYPCVNESALIFDKTVLVQKKKFNKLSEIITPHGKLSIGIMDNKLSIKQQQETFSIQLINGIFPDVSDILFIKDARHVILNKQLFMMMLKHMSSFATDDYKGVIINLNDNKMIITSTNPELRASKEEIIIVYPDSPIEVAIHPEYLLEALSVIEEEQIVISIVDDQTPCLIEGEKDKSYLCAIMPMKIR